ncbi:MAG: OmpA family protein [Rhodanobacteraceae bacterium]|nr:OmpA family protein [Rhodanobacteraceae bacterium]MBK7042651.1 OmpA family protein [Rhodanobacteraceae bacterium]HQW80483.1 OmpA family protein [Pseudomonadota bacterium]
MNRKHLCALIALALGAGAVSAQDYDSRWYVAPAVGVSHNDNERYVDSDDTEFGSLGFGRFVAENTSLDLSIDYTSRNLGSQYHFVGDLDSFALSASLRHYFTDWSWRPFLKVGLGLSEARVTDQALSYGTHRNVNPIFDAGLGFGHDVNDAVALRTELNYRYDMDDQSIPGVDHFGDWIATFGATFKFGESSAPAAKPAADPAAEPATPAEPAAPADCSTLDDDNDGVNNCDDQCLTSAAGEAVGADGCAQAIVIDLRGVNFAFDRAELTAESTAILDQAVDVLNRYPALKVEVAGHTDSVGTDAYNQGLSERRAKTVYQFLTSKGIAADRLSGPNGYGEGKPIDTNDTSEGRARNRRTELVKQQ